MADALHPSFGWIDEAQEEDSWIQPLSTFIKPLRGERETNTNPPHLSMKLSDIN